MRSSWSESRVNDVEWLTPSLSSKVIEPCRALAMMRVRPRIAPSSSAPRASSHPTRNPRLRNLPESSLMADRLVPRTTTMISTRLIQ